ncbi:MAG: dihydroorotase [Magnetospiraceae bacterium]
MTQTLTIPRPDDWHLHLRDDAMLRAVLPHTARDFGRAIVMPNLVPPVTDQASAAAYRTRILELLPDDTNFTPLMTCYMTDKTDPAELRAGAAAGLFSAVKLYPAGATTNSDHGVTRIENIYPVLETMAEIDLPLLVHGEVTDPAVDIFDREAVFIDRILNGVRERFPTLRIVLEHVTTADGVAFVRGAGARTAGTITPHHLFINRNHLFKGGLRPHHYCLPVAKRERHRLALVGAAISGESQFFLGTDSAPHTVARKEMDCGCAGVFNAPTALACTVQIFDDENALDHLADFTSRNGPGFYGLPVSGETVTLEKRETPLDPPAPIQVETGEPVNVFFPDQPVYWHRVDG